MIIIIIFFSAIFGSFLNMLIYRLPKMIMGENISPIYPQQSFCPKCKHTLSGKDLLAILSFLSSFGKCRYCKDKIKIRYFLVEIISVVSIITLYNIFGLSIDFYYFLPLTFGLITLFWIDFETKLLPDIITIPLVWLGLVYNMQFGDINSSIIGAIVGYLSLWSVFWLFKIIRGKEGLGYGDFKLFAVFGAWFGWQILNPILLIAAILGIIYYLIKIKNKNKEFAFGPLLITALPIILMVNTYFYTFF